MWDGLMQQHSTLAFFCLSESLFFCKQVLLVTVYPRPVSLEIPFKLNYSSKQEFVPRVTVRTE